MPFSKRHVGDQNDEESRIIRVALVQFDSKPEAVSHNLKRMRDLVEQASKASARWIMFHEGTVCDYTAQLDRYAEHVPGGQSTQFMIALAKEYDCYISFGLSEKADGKYYISQVFVGPDGFLYRYRKTWL